MGRIDVVCVWEVHRIYAKGTEGVQILIDGPRICLKIFRIIKLCWINKYADHDFVRLCLGQRAKCGVSIVQSAHGRNETNRISVILPLGELFGQFLISAV